MEDWGLNEFYHTLEFFDTYLNDMKLNFTRRVQFLGAIS